MTEIDVEERKTVFATFLAWAKGSEKHGDNVKHLGKYVVEMAEDAFVELRKLQPNSFDEWYVRHHMRYYDVPDWERRLLFSMLHEFLEHWFHGRIERPT